MPKQVHYNAAEHISADTRRRSLSAPGVFAWRPVAAADVERLLGAPLPVVAPSTALLESSAAAVLWGDRWGRIATFTRGSRVWAPWNLICADQVSAADGVEIYNPAPIRFGSHAILSQQAYVCGATHDYDDPAFPLIAYSMSIGDLSWVCARASVAPGVNVGEGAVLGLGSVATRSLEAWTVYAGVPATKVKERRRPLSR